MESYYKLNIDTGSVSYAVRKIPEHKMVRVVRREVSVSYVVKDKRFFGGYANHRLDGPASIMNVINGIVAFWIYGTKYYRTQDYCHAAGMSEEETLMWVLRFGDELPNTCEEYYGKRFSDLCLEEV